jgi:hypothetical protein
VCALLWVRVRQAHRDSGDERYRRVEGMTSQEVKSGRDSIVEVNVSMRMMGNDLELHWSQAL